MGDHPINDPSRTTTVQRGYGGLAKRERRPPWALRMGNGRRSRVGLLPDFRAVPVAHLGYYLVEHDEFPPQEILGSHSG